MSTDDEYARLNGARVQVLERFEAFRSCAVCGGEPQETGKPCPACGGAAAEETPREFARVALLSGENEGKSQIVFAAALGDEVTT